MATKTKKTPTATKKTPTKSGSAPKSETKSKSGRVAVEPAPATEKKVEPAKPETAKPEKPAKKVKPVATVALTITGPTKISCQYKGDSHRATLNPDGTVVYNGLTVSAQRAMKLACAMEWSPTLQTAWRGWRVAEGEQKGQAIGDLRKDGLFHSKPKAEKPAPVEEPAKPAKPAKPSKKTKTATGKASA